MAELPSGTVTFLFSDVEGSTGLWERDRAGMHAAVERHLAVLRSVVVAHRGVLYKVVGDGTQSAFASAEAGVRAALDAQRALLAEPWSTVPGPLRARMALHAGQAAPQDGDYLAAPLNRLARILEAAHGGQVLLSDTVAGLVRDALPAGVRLKALGEFRLRDILEPEELFQLQHAALPTAFPPLNTVGERPHNLPTHPTPFLGREWELTALATLLLRPEVRLVTLTGPGGVGKTRLGLRAAAEALEAFAHGVFFVDLARITDPDLVAAATATALGLREQPGQTMTEALTSYLRDKRMLLVFDNFEHLLPAAPLVAALLAAAPGLKVLATSRARLGLQAEHEVQVEPLPVPDQEQLPPLAELAHNDAVALFVARARALRPGFALTEANARAVSAIVCRLDGLPLAIELAAAWSRLLPPAALEKQLAARLLELGGGPRDAPARQQTIRSTIGWSFDLLDPEDQALFVRLGIFAGGWTIDAAQAISGPEPPDILPGLGRLFDRSLVYRAPADDEEPRFTMLDTIRAYAREQLALRGERDAVERRRRDYFLPLATHARQMLGGQDHAKWLSRLEDEHDNLRAVLDRALETRDAATALRLGTVLWQFWAERGHLTEGRAKLELALAIDEPVAPTIRADAIYILGNIAVDLGDPLAARKQYAQNLELVTAMDDQNGIADAHNGLGLVEHDLGAYDQARRHFEAALEIWSKLGDVAGSAIAHFNLGRVFQAEGELERAGASHREALTLRQQLGDVYGAAYSQWALANVARATGDSSTARTLYEDSLRVFKQLGDRQGEAFVLYGLGRIAQQLGDDLRALQLLRDALNSHRRSGERSYVVECIEAIASILVRRGYLEQAVRLLGTVMPLRGTAVAAATVGEREEQEQTLKMARRSLTDSAFEAAWNVGRALSLDQAAAEALRLTEEKAVITRPPAPFKLTRREQEVLHLLCQHLTDPEIAAHLYLSPRTASNHVASIIAKLGVANRREAVAFATQHGLA
jgi:predicted ATPase/class 3 adenylate cyclase/DNA-binding CsgD family transcriptional regulator